MCSNAMCNKSRCYETPSSSVLWAIKLTPCAMRIRTSKLFLRFSVLFATLACMRRCGKIDFHEDVLCVPDPVLVKLRWSVWRLAATRPCLSREVVPSCRFRIYLVWALPCVDLSRHVATGCSQRLLLHFFCAAACRRSCDFELLFIW